MIRSLRARLMWGIGTAAALILLGAMGAGYALVRSSLIDEFDTSLITEAHSIAAMTEVRKGQIFVDAEPGELPEFQRRERPEVYQLLGDDGRTFAKSQAIGNAQSIGNLRDHASPGRTHLPDGRPGRFVSYHYVLRAEDHDRSLPQTNVTVVVARDTLDLIHSLDRIGSVFLLAATLATVAIVLVTVSLISRGLRPIQRLSQQIADIDTHNLASRFESPGLPTELAPIVSRLNELLERLHSAFDRERNFTADAAHELRTPLAGLEAALEVCESRRREPEAYQKVVRECLRVARSMHGMVDDLLLLARSDAGQVPLGLEIADTEDLIAESWRPFHARADARSLTASFDTPPLAVETDPARLGHVLSHLFDNAVCHANEGGDIRVVSGLVESNLSIRIANSGSRVAVEDTEKVFDRFWRADRSRTGTVAHSGLGLAVCRKLVEALRGTITIESTLGGEFAVEVRLPLAEAVHRTRQTQEIH